MLCTCVLALLLMLWAELVRGAEMRGGPGAAEAQTTVSGLAGQRFGQGDSVVGAVPVVVENVLGGE